jgi:hypothetical protein
LTHKAGTGPRILLCFVRALLRNSRSLARQNGVWYGWWPTGDGVGFLDDLTPLPPPGLFTKGKVLSPASRFAASSLAPEQLLVSLDHAPAGLAAVCLRVVGRTRQAQPKPDGCHDPKAEPALWSMRDLLDPPDDPAAVGRFSRPSR